MFPRLLDLGRISIPTYGVLSALGLILGLLICVKLAKREGIDPDRAWNLGMYSIIAAVIGSKLMLLVTDWTATTEALRLAFTGRRAAALGVLQAGGALYSGVSCC